jgi:hypothetical protein
MELLACSGPGAAATIARSIEIGYTHAAVVCTLFLLSLSIAAFGTRRWGVPAVLAVLLLLHPAWTISAIHGDCGYFKRDASWVFTIVGCTLICCQVACRFWRWRATKRDDEVKSDI